MRKRRLIARVCINTALTLSLIVLATSLGLWFRGRSKVDLFTPFDRKNALDVVLLTGTGKLFIGVNNFNWEGTRHRSWEAETDRPTVEKLAWRLFWGDGDYSGGRRGDFALMWRSDEYHFAVVLMPIWTITLLAAVVPGCALAGWLRRRRRMNDLRCGSCGYDLRATPGRCPECGTVPAK